jgi:hypothetical protein
MRQGQKWKTIPKKQRRRKRKLRQLEIEAMCRDFLLWAKRLRESLSG